MQCSASLDARHTPATRIKIDTDALGINWTQGETYRIEVVQDAFTEIGNNRYTTPAIGSAFVFTTNSTGTTIVDTYPDNNKTGWRYNEVIELTFDRDIQFNTSGSIVLRVVAGSDVATYTSASANWTISGRVLTLNLDYALESSTSYELEVVGDPIVDVDGFVTDETGVVLNFTTYVGPELLSTVPTLNETGVDYNDQITLTYNTNLAFTTIQTGPLVTLTPSGPVQISTTKSQFGGSSAKFSAGTSRIDADMNVPNTGDFTIEYWINQSDRSAIRGHFHIQKPGVPSGSYHLTAHTTTGVGGPMFVELTDETGAVEFSITTSQAVPDQTWRHIALVRSGNVFTVYSNGNSVGTATSSGVIPQDNMFTIGRSLSQSMSGYLDEFRISNVARYTSNFTPPTSAFLADSNTILLVHADGTNGSTNFEDSSNTTVNEILLYEVVSGGSDIEVAAFRKDNGITLTDNVASLALNGLLESDKSYYLIANDVVFEDLQEFRSSDYGYNFTEFTTYPGPAIVSQTATTTDYLLSADLNVTFDRDIVLNGSGSINLYDSSNVLIHTYSASAPEITVSNETLTADVTSYVESDVDYYLQFDNVIADTEQFILSTGQSGNIDIGVNYEVLLNPDYYNTGTSTNTRIAVSENYLILGDPFQDSPAGDDEGIVYVFDLNTRNLIHTVTNPNPTTGESTLGRFGSVVAINDTYFAALGANKVYVYNTSTGALVHTIVNPDANSAGFGASLALHTNDYIVVGSPSSSKVTVNNGTAHVFNLSDGSLRFEIPNPVTGDSSIYNNFGSAVATDGNRIVISAPKYPNIGSTVKDRGIVYTFSPTTGALINTINNPTSGNPDDDFFGNALSMANGRLLVSTRWAESSQGNAWLFNSSNGSLIRSFPNPSTGGAYGHSSSLSNTHAYVAAQFASTGSSGDSGVVYCFDVTNGNLVNTIVNPILGTTPSTIFGAGVSVNSAEYIAISATVDSESRVYLYHQDNIT